ncbi:Metallo-hydrolase/oxidoreductase [Annulohypoxylon maeteangense]|uniref:Metallo-hydrolase/oxidoreductase n=1 Tax=Annulohypoxylon maeteangense TaxID=1927788 RepID=UPI00200772F7|nr:Metallo-hydrolase/oxidoreductase [Annulohypoxylon maeteangense]KAI0887440.1 Metallo-hydrolase/oxidoreductase [Annulohypoxylon maeteangense]
MAKPPANTGVALTFMSTGTVQIRQLMKNQPMTNRNVTMRRLRAMTDPHWSSDLPIGVFLITHPNGPILFDTGESPCCNDPGFHPFYSPIKLFSRTRVAKEDGIVSQLRAQGVEPKDLQAIVLSHLHGDHAGGLEDLAKAAPEVPVYVSAAHWKVFGNSPVSATIAGCNPQRWPPDFAPRLLGNADGAVGPWEKSTKLTADGRVLVVDTPGHVPGHVSLIVRGDNEDGTQTTYFLPGDATYGLDLLDLEEPDGINDDPVTALKSLLLIKEFARQGDVVVLPSHDADTPRLLRDRVVYKPKDP